MRKTDSCWNWIGSLSTGYGRFCIGGNHFIAAHRYSLRLLGIEAPEGMEVDHLCRNRACVRPEHLEIVTHTENVRRGLATYAQKMLTCKRGHLWAENAAYVGPGRERWCKACRRQRDAERRAAA